MDQPDRFVRTELVLVDWLVGQIRDAAPGTPIQQLERLASPQYCQESLMRGLIVSRNPDFGAALAGIVESIGSNESYWQPNWVVTDNELANYQIVICHLEDDENSSVIEHLIDQIKRSSESISVVVIGNNLSTATKLNVLKAGVLDYLDRPVNLQRLRFLIDSVGVRYQTLQKRVPKRKPQSQSKFFDGWLTQEIDRVANTDTNLCLCGETGVGKTHVARRVHESSTRSRRPFVAINCAAIPDNLFESELFGHRRGAFTGADTNRHGKLAEAAGGTILLDEIDAVPIGIQAKLLHVVEDRQFQAIGCNKTIHLNARIIAATNQSLKELAQKKLFREDLYYRLDVYQIDIPPLRERPEFLNSLLDTFVAQFANNFHKTIHGYSEDVLRLLTTYSWPGNIRELKNVIECATLRASSKTIKMKDLPDRFIESVNEQGDLTTTDSGTYVIRFDRHSAVQQDEVAADSNWNRKKEEIQKLMQTMQENKFNRTKTAQELGISRTALYKRLNKFHLA